MTIEQLIARVIQIMAYAQQNFDQHYRTLTDFFTQDTPVTDRQVGIIRAIRDDVIDSRNDVRQCIVAINRFLRMFGRPPAYLAGEVAEFILDLNAPVTNTRRMLARLESDLDQMARMLDIW